LLAAGAVGLFLAFGPSGEDQAAPSKDLAAQSASSQNPSAKSEDSGAKTKDPAAGTQSPVAKSKDPAPKPEIPAAKPKAPQVVQAEIPPGPVPAAMNLETVRKVKKATAYLRVKLSGGEVAEGTGFFGLEPGIVFTNAHVLGMMQADSKPPVSVEVVVNSGESEELKLVGSVLGVDRATDLAVLRVQGDAGRMPPPLPVDSARGLVETQKVYIFGFPFGAKLGKNITVSESSVTSLRRDDAGVLAQVQVNGGMHPGNSGGPVTDARGVVIGVSVAIIKGTQINFAVPADFVKQMLDGRLAETELGVPYLDKGQARMPIRFACLDPLARIRAVRVEVWTGAPTPARPMSSQPPKPHPGDGPRQAIPVNYVDGAGTAEIPLPKAADGQVVWVQPVLTTSTGSSQWAAATVYRPDARHVLERRPALLQLKYPAQQAERSLKVKSTARLKAMQAREVIAAVDAMDFAVLELIRAEPRGAQVRIAFGECSAKAEGGDKTFKRHPEAAKLLRRLTAGFVLDPAGAFKLLSVAQVRSRDEDLEQDLGEMYSRACASFQATCLAMPNRTLSPMETWTAKPVMFMGGKGRLGREVLDLSLTCTYEGVRTNNGRSEAYIRLEGDVKGSGGKITLTGKAKGHAVLDLEGGYLSEVKITVTSEVEAERIRLGISLDTELTRTPGNLHKIVPPAAAPGQMPPFMQPGPGQMPPFGPPGSGIIPPYGPGMRPPFGPGQMPPYGPPGQPPFMPPNPGQLPPVVPPGPGGVPPGIVPPGTGSVPPSGPFGRK
jgi:S1-C subfamily serine protease